MKKSIYICGKVSDLPYKKVKEKFSSAQQYLEGKGYHVVNPLEIITNRNMGWHECMRLCIAALVECDGIYPLQDWRFSRGTRIEMELAANIGIDIYDN